MPSNKRKRPLLIKRPQAAALCGIPIASWDRLHALGRNPAPLRFGSACYYRVAELKAWVAAGCPARREWAAIWAAERERRRLLREAKRAKRAG